MRITPNARAVEAREKARKGCGQCRVEFFLYLAFPTRRRPAYLPSAGSKRVGRTCLIRGTKASQSQNSFRQRELRGLECEDQTATSKGWAGMEVGSEAMVRKRGRIGWR